MDIITEEDLQAVIPEVIKEKNQAIEIQSADFDSLLEKMANPVEQQKELGVKLKQFLDIRMEEEMADKGFLSESTRRWLSDYNTILNNVHKNLYGDKSTNINVNVVSHSSIASKIRKFKKK